ncbi:MAG: rhodanese-like domain-containing protein, partial [Planctomycetota bacterium]|nr:rhodanese-like domain-containing protein [Planctomycetota bacterium]
LPMQIDVDSASRLLTEDESVLLLDVRELAEYETVHLPNSLLIPTSEFMEKIQQLKGIENQRILVICHHGVRSQGAATWMRANGFEQAQSISGGIDAWAVQLDPGLTRY